MGNIKVQLLVVMAVTVVEVGVGVRDWPTSTEFVFFREIHPLFPRQVTMLLELLAVSLLCKVASTEFAPTLTRLKSKSLKFIFLSRSIVGITKKNLIKHIYRSLIHWRWRQPLNRMFIMSLGVQTQMGAKQLAFAIRGNAICNPL